MIKLRQIEHFDFLYWTIMDKLKFKDWSQVNRMFFCGNIVIFQLGMMIWKNASSNFVGPQ